MDPKELSITAQLAMIAPSEEEFDRLAIEVERMLAYFEMMKNFEGPAAGMAPLVAPACPSAARPDRAKTPSSEADAPGVDRTVAEMLDQAPDLEGRLIVIPNVL